MRHQPLHTFHQQLVALQGAHQGTLSLPQAHHHLAAKSQQRAQPFIDVRVDRQQFAEVAGLVQALLALRWLSVVPLKTRWVLSFEARTQVPRSLLNGLAEGVRHRKIDLEVTRFRAHVFFKDG